MSQKKVDNYRAGKYGRSKAARKERIIDKLEILAWIAICVAMVGWIGFSAYTKIEAKEASTVTETVMILQQSTIMFQAFRLMQSK